MPITTDSVSALELGAAAIKTYPRSFLIYVSALSGCPQNFYPLAQHNSSNWGNGWEGASFGSYGDNKKVEGNSPPYGGWAVGISSSPHLNYGTSAVLRPIVVVFVSASNRRVYFAGNIGSDSTTSYPDISAGFDGFALGSSLLGQIAEAHIYNVALSDAQVASLVGNGGSAKPEELSGWFDGFQLKDYNPAGTYVSMGGSRTLTAVGTGISAGTSAHPVSRTVAGPTISTQPTNQSASSGATFIFTAAATASGGGTLSYQWQKNGSNISGATSASYTGTAGTDGANGDAFRLVATETGGTNPGSTNSNAATLTVTSASAKSGRNFFYARRNPQ